MELINAVNSVQSLMNRAIAKWGYTDGTRIPCFVSEQDFGWDESGQWWVELPDEPIGIIRCKTGNRFRETVKRELELF